MGGYTGGEAVRKGGMKTAAFSLPLAPCRPRRPRPAVLFPDARPDLGNCIAGYRHREACVQLDGCMPCRRWRSRSWRLSNLEGPEPRNAMRCRLQPGPWRDANQAMTIPEIRAGIREKQRRGVGRLGPAWRQWQ